MIVAYLAKYATKSTDGSVAFARRFSDRRQIERVEGDAARPTARAYRLGPRRARRSSSDLRLRRHAHAFGFTGQLITKSQGFSTTFRALRGARAAHMAGVRRVEPSRSSAPSRYAGRGYSDPRGEARRRAPARSDRRAAPGGPRAARRGPPGRPGMSPEMSPGIVPMGPGIVPGPTSDEAGSPVIARPGTIAWTIPGTPGCLPVRHDTTHRRTAAADPRAGAEIGLPERTPGPSKVRGRRHRRRRRRRRSATWSPATTETSPRDGTGRRGHARGAAGARTERPGRRALRAGGAAPGAAAGSPAASTGRPARPTTSSPRSWPSRGRRSATAAEARATGTPRRARRRGPERGRSRRRRGDPAQRSTTRSTDVDADRPLPDPAERPEPLLGSGRGGGCAHPQGRRADRAHDGSSASRSSVLARDCDVSPRGRSSQRRQRAEAALRAWSQTDERSR